MRADARDVHPAAPRTDGVLLDLLMAVMNSLEVWIDAAGDRENGLAWRDATTRAMASSGGAYMPYGELIDRAGVEVGVTSGATERLFDRWRSMRPWPDATALGDLPMPYAFVTNCSSALAEIAADRSGLDPRFALAAEEVGGYKPRREIYRLACTRLGIPPHRVLFVAGSPYDAEGASAAGMRAALVRRRADQPAPGGEVTVLRSLVEVAGLVNGWERGRLRAIRAR